MMNKIPLLFFSLFIFISSCTKTELEIKNIDIDGNVPPPDYTIDSSVLSIYVNKAYINLAGREPFVSEKSDALAILRQHNFSEADRKQFIATFFNKEEYLLNQYNVANNEYLRNLDSTEIALIEF